MSAKESREMYLEVILKLEKRNGVVRSVDIANEFNYSKPSINRAMGILKEAGYITHSHYSDIALTEKGRKKAGQIYRLHHIVTEFLIKSLELDKSIAEQDACRIEHIISEQTVAAIEKYLGSK